MTRFKRQPRVPLWDSEICAELGNKVPPAGAERRGDPPGSDTGGRRLWFEWLTVLPHCDHGDIFGGEARWDLSEGMRSLDSWLVAC
jgi:hypothetical protein